MTDPPGSARVEVPLRRLEAWLAGFARRNGEVVSVSVSGAQAVLASERGATAVLHLPGVADGASLDAAVAWARRERRLAVLLVRRGGYAVGLLRGAESFAEEATRTGTRYVQGRTAAGGQSQQRFARRRANQAAGLAGAATKAAVDVLGVRPRPVDLLVTGGDTALLADVLADPRLAWLADLPRAAVEVGDPRRRTLAEAAARAVAVPVDVTNA